MGTEAAQTSQNIDPLVGTVLDGRYKIERLLGEGGMGVVYLATHTALNKKLAVKVLRGDVSKDEEILARFRQEAQSASSIGNEHIIDISDFGALSDGSTYFVMEYLDGRSLSAALEEQRPFSTARAVHILKQLCRALGAAHERGIVHRDLKPDNIYLVSRSHDADFVKVLDFGIAKVGGATSKLTRAGQVFGTPHYMSPEQCQGSEVDQRTDVYAAGVIFYEMLTGAAPFDSDNLMGILTKHLYEAPVPPSKRTPPVAIDPNVEQVLLRALEKKAERRYASMAALRADLDALDGGMPLSNDATYTGAVRAVAASTGEIPVLPSRKSNAAMIAGAFALIAVVAAGAFFALNKEPVTAPEDVATAPTSPPTNVVAPSPAPAAQAFAPTPTAKTRLVTTPAQVDVYRGGALLGSTPLDLERPTPGAELQLELRSVGYESKQVLVTSVSPDALNITLTALPPVKASNGAASRSRTRTENGGGRDQNRGGGMGAGSDIRDPWAN